MSCRRGSEAKPQVNLASGLSSARRDPLPDTHQIVIVVFFVLIIIAVVLIIIIVFIFF